MSHSFIHLVKIIFVFLGKADTDKPFIMFTHTSVRIYQPKDLGFNWSVYDREEGLVNLILRWVALASETYSMKTQISADSAFSQLKMSTQVFCCLGGISFGRSDKSFDCSERSWMGHT